MNILLLKHGETNRSLLNKIIDLKNQYWIYSKEQHLDWFTKNITNEDYHLLVENENHALIGYLNFVKIIVTDDRGQQTNCFGIGNVCVDKNSAGMGLGLLVMQTANYYLKNKQMQGMLLCKEALVPFYQKANWTIFNGAYTLNGCKLGAALMFLNPINTKLLVIDKDF